ncbi:MAG TPA: phosphotransferase [Verrucomicrobiae bacterium]|nr:phosphotransferase [Verrucomicrobiae bacterium]
MLASGLTAEVFSWGNGRVLKLFFPWMPEVAIHREFAIAQAITGIPAPAVYEMIKIAGRHGIVFERVEGVSMLKQAERKPTMLFAGARQLAELHARIHSQTAPPTLPAQRDKIERYIEDAEDFTPAQKAVARRIAAELPKGTALCHGDFHPANVLFGARGPVIIDWGGATRGHPLADVARTSVLIESAKLPEGTPLHIQMLMKVSRSLLHATYLKRYLELRPGTMDEIEKWRVPQRMAASAWRARKKAGMAKLSV